MKNEGKRGKRNKKQKNIILTLLVNVNIKILKRNMNTHVHMQTCKQHPKLSNIYEDKA